MYICELMDPERASPCTNGTRTIYRGRIDERRGEGQRLYYMLSNYGWIKGWAVTQMTLKKYKREAEQGDSWVMVEGKSSGAIDLQMWLDISTLDNFRAQICAQQLLYQCSFVPGRHRSC